MAIAQEPVTQQPVRVLVVFYSKGGLTERLAVLLAEGALQGGANIRLRRARDVASEEEIASIPGWREERDRMHAEYAAPTQADAEWADAILFGTPAAPGKVSTELEAYLAQLGALATPGNTAVRIASAFTSSYAPEAGAALVSLQVALLKLGFLVAPGSGEIAVGADDYEKARIHGRAMAMLAGRLRA